jgi:minichromosome maintenance protein 10
MDGRYHLSPSQLYSVARPSRGGSELEVPIDGDFILIGVLAEKSQIKTTNPQTVKIETEDNDAERAIRAGDDEPPSKKRKVTSAPARKAKKYVSFKLIDLGRRNGTGGDAVLNLMLFEADAATFAATGDESDEETTATGVRVQREGGRGRSQAKRYAGGSGGAYEKFWKESDGAVVAVLNPRLMKPRPVRRVLP